MKTAEFEAETRTPMAEVSGRAGRRMIIDQRIFLSDATVNSPITSSSEGALCQRQMKLRHFARVNFERT